MKKFCLFILLFIVANTVYPQWSNDPYVNTRVSDWGVSPMTVEEGNGGEYVKFDYPSYDSSHSYLQRINFDGTIDWAEPIKISNDVGNVSNATEMFLTDDTNDLIIGYLSGIFYFDTTLGRFEYRLNPYVQRFDSNGNKLWGVNGIRLKKDTTKLDGVGVIAVPDGNDGTICFWTFHTGGTAGGHILLQKVSQYGELLWGDNGIMVADSVEFTNNMWMVSDYEGGIILQYIKWIQNQRHYLIQRYDSTGALIWTLDDKIYTSIIRDGEGGIVVSFTKEYYPEEDTLYINRITHNGQKIWGENGIGIFVTQQSNIKPVLHLNIDSTVTAFWSEYVYPSYNMYAQRLNLNGEKLWEDNFRITDTVSSQWAVATLKSDDNSNIFIWEDGRELPGLYSQRIDKYGTKVWGDTDIVITYQILYSDYASVTDGNGGAIVVWSYDTPFGGILAQQISRNGKLGEIIDAVNEKSYSFINKYKLEQNYPNPFNPSTTIRFSLPSSGQIKLEIYNLLGEKVQTLVNEFYNVGIYKVEFNAEKIPSGIYFYSISSGDFHQTKKMVLMK